MVAVADLGRGLGAGSRAPDVVVGRLAGPVGDPAGTRFGMRLPVAAGESLRLWELVELCREEEDAEVAEALRLVYVAASRAKLPGIPRGNGLERRQVLVHPVDNAGPHVAQRQIIDRRLQPQKHACRLNNRHEADGCAGQRQPETLPDDEHDDARRVGAEREPDADLAHP